MFWKLFWKLFLKSVLKSFSASYFENVSKMRTLDTRIASMKVDTARGNNFWPISRFLRVLKQK